MTGVSGQARLISNLKQGKQQVLVVYGTSLSAGPGGKVWVDAVAKELNRRYDDLLVYYNAGKSAMWSTWGVQHLEDSVVSKRPDAVLIEFAINDAFSAYNTSPQLAELNLEYMIHRLRLYNPECEVILQIMNPPSGQHAAERPQLLDYYEIYQQVADRHRLLLINHDVYWQQLLSEGIESFRVHVPDGIHPDAEAARSLIAPFIVQTLEK